MKNKLICGIGINDVDYIVSSCPYYKIWFSMLYRCYSDKYQTTHPTYKGCSVSKDWLIFSNFKKWMQIQDWKGKQLDKDIIKINNRIYSKTTCCFVTQEINLLLNKNSKTKSIYGLGVTIRNNGKFIAKLNIHPKKIHLGTFETSLEASNAYNKAKSDRIKFLAEKQCNPLIKKGLLTHAKLYKQRMLVCL